MSTRKSSSCTSSALSSTSTTLCVRSASLQSTLPCNRSLCSCQLSSRTWDTPLPWRNYIVSHPTVACILSISVAFASDRTRLRGIYLATFPILCIIGFAILRTSDNPNIKYMGVFFSAAGAFPGGPGFLSWGLNNAAGPAVRAVTGGYIVSIGSFGAILATYVSRPRPIIPLEYH
jgi:hypothetical protein